MNYSRQILLACFLYPLVLLSQPFNPSRLDVVVLEEKLLEVVNKYRVEQGYQPLALDGILRLAAKDQARYIKAVKKLTHDQLFTGKETPKERVSSHNGVFGALIENLAIVQIQADYEVQAQAIWDYWKTQKAGRNLTNPIHAFMGAFFVADPTSNELYVVQILAGKPFKAFQGEEIIEDAFSIQAYDATSCHIIAENPYLTSDLPLHLRLFGSSIYLEYHDKAVLQEIINGPRDGLAIDIIHKDQFECAESIDLYPSPVHDGYLLEPILSKALYRNNQHPDTNRLYTYLGKVPASLEPKQLQLNVIVIKDNIACTEQFPVAVPFSNLPLFRINPIWAFGADEAIQPIQVAAVGHPNRSHSRVVQARERLQLQFDKSSVKFLPAEWDKVKQFITKYSEEIDSIQVFAYSSIEGSTSTNLLLQQERADTIKIALQKLGVDSLKIQAQAAENWQLFYQQILGTKWSQFGHLDKTQVKQNLQRPDVEKALQHLLAKQREAQVFIHYKQKRNEAFSPYEIATTTKEAQAKLIELQTAINQQRTEKALRLQEELIRLFLAFEVKLSDLTTVQIPLTPSNKWLLSNQLALELFFKKHIRTDEAYIEQVKEIQALAPLHLAMQFNYLGYAVRYLYQEGKPLEEPEDLNAAILQLYDRPTETLPYQDISSALDRLMVNFHLAAVDYYFHQRDYSLRNTSMLAIQDFFSEKEISEAEALSLTKFFNRNYYLDWSLETMKPYLQRKDASQNLFFTYLQTYTIWKGEERGPNYYQLLDQCLAKNQKRLCAWLKTYFQLQRDEKIRALFCENCD